MPRSVIRLAGAAALGGLLFGYETAVINGAAGAIQQQFEAGAAALGFAVGAVLIGAAGGALVGGRISDRFGRVPIMRIAALLFLISALGCAFPTGIEEFVAFRVLGGIGVGIASVIAPAYIAEIAPARVRGRLGALQQLAIVSGIFLSLLVNALLARLAGGADQTLWFGLDAWQWMFIAMGIPAIAYGVCAFTIPESPRNLVARGKDQAAEKVLQTLGDPEPGHQVERIRESIASDRKPSFKDLRGSAFGLQRVVWVAIVFNFFVQFTGINVIFYYSSVLWNAVGFSEEDSFVISVFTSIVNIVVTVIGMTLIDRIGRKPMLLIGSAGMTVTLGLMAYLFATATLVDVNGSVTPDLGPVAGPLALIAANLFVVFFGLTWGTVTWVLLGEMFPNRMRGAGLALAGFAQWVANWVITVTFPMLKEANLGIAYGLYALFALLSFFFVARFIRETRGVALEDVTAG
ncbi:sugar porter family MFS transporter [Rhodococcus sp. NPDC057529]|uniref:sugar porter family MFS transporter n=1 Tax=Rhodococcus sp. NPDC057529 TaxID=3346158 RepID=UPI00366D576E